MDDNGTVIKSMFVFLAIYIYVYHQLLTFLFKYVYFFATYPKHLIESGTRGYTFNYTPN